MKGESYVPEGIWRPTDCYIANQRDVMELVTHVEKPEIADLKDGVSANGMLLWPTEYVGTLSNPMSLRAFPFDSDHIEIILHQSESSQSEDYIFRPCIHAGRITPEATRQALAPSSDSTRGASTPGGSPTPASLLRRIPVAHEPTARALARGRRRRSQG